LLDPDGAQAVEDRIEACGTFVDRAHDAAGVELVGRVVVSVPVVHDDRRPATTVTPHPVTLRPLGWAGSLRLGAPQIVDVGGLSLLPPVGGGATGAEQQQRPRQPAAVLARVVVGGTSTRSARARTAANASAWACRSRSRALVAR
jgi:hypothetical protein